MFDIPIAPRVHFLTPNGEHYVARDTPDNDGSFVAFDESLKSVKCNLSMVVLSWRLCIHRLPTMSVDTCDHDLATTCCECDQPILFDELTGMWKNIYGFNSALKCNNHRPY